MYGKRPPINSDHSVRYLIIERSKCHVKRQLALTWEDVCTQIIVVTHLTQYLSKVPTELTI